MMNQSTVKRCSCWDKFKPQAKKWREEVMADGHGYCKHCALPMTRYWPEVTDHVNERI